MKFKENAKIGIGFVGGFGGVAEHVKNIMKFSKYPLIPIYPPHNKWIRKYTYLTIWTNLDPLGHMIIGKNKNFDTVHVHGAPYLARYVSKNKGKFTKNYIQTLHAIYHPKILKEDYPNKKIWKFKEKENNILIDSSKRAEVVICVAKWLSELLEEEYNVKSICIPNGVEVSDFENIDAHTLKNIKRKYKLPNEYFLFVGRLHPVKRPELFIELAKRQPDKIFVMIGKGLNKESIQKYLGYKLPPNIISLDFIHRESIDFAGLIVLSKVFILPSKNDTFPTAIMEAMAAKKVVVAANSAGPAEIIRNGIDGYLFEPDNLDDLEEKALKAWETPQLGENGYQRVKVKYDWRVIIKDIDKIYESLL